MTFTPTDEQIACIEAARDSEENLIVIARAGAAKTSTLVLMAEAIPTKSVLCLAFNKKIAAEMTERLPENCESKTLHSLGFAAWRDFIPGRCNIKDRKVYFLLRDTINELEKDEQEEAWGCFSETLDFIRKSKQVGWLPEAYKGHWRPLLDDADFFGNLPLEPSPLQRDLIRTVATLSFKQALAGVLDFDDMVFCPALCPVSFPRFDIVMVDEAQDLSALNHHLLQKLVGPRRLIAVGDPCQAIYGFRGADTRSMENMQRRFSMTPLTLTTSFRCGRKIIENARWRAPDMKAASWAEPGEVHRPLTWSPADLEPGDAIVCRNNAPLFGMAIRMLQNDLLPELSGRDIGATIKKIMKKLGKPEMARPLAEHALAEWKGRELARARDGAAGQIHDMADCISLFLEQTSTLGDAMAYLDHLLTREGRIHLMTGHKSKGLEFDRVWFLDPHLCRIDKHEQDANIKYVVETRAKKFLAYVATETFEDGTASAELSG